MGSKKNNMLQQIEVLLPPQFDIDLLKRFDKDKLQRFYELYVKKCKTVNLVDGMYPVSAFYTRLGIMLISVFVLLFSSYQHLYGSIASSSMNKFWLDFFKLYYDNQASFSFVSASVVSLLYISGLKLKHESEFKDKIERYNNFNVKLAHKCLLQIDPTYAKVKKNEIHNNSTLTTLRHNVKVLQQIFDEEIELDAKDTNKKNTKNEKQDNDRKFSENPVRVRLVLKDKLDE